MKVQWLHATMQAWRRSFALGMPQQILLLIGVTMLGWLKLVKRFWWFLLLLGGVGWLTHWLLVSSATFLFLASGFALALLHAAGMILLVGIVRPSVAEKNFSYFVWLLRANYLIALAICCGSFLLASLSSSLLVTLIVGGFSGDVIYWPLAWWYSSPFVIFYMLLIIDGVQRSWWRALLMTWYDYPACFVTVILMVGINRLIGLMGDSWWASMAGSSILYFCVIPVVMQLFVNLYSKRVHEHYEEYFS